MVKHADRWPPAYYRAINQLADVIATFPPEKVPPFQLREVTDDLEIALNRRHRADYEAPVMPASLITASKSESGGENAGEPARAWRPRHVHVRSLKGGSNGRARIRPPPATCGSASGWYNAEQSTRRAALPCPSSAQRPTVGSRRVG